MNNINFLHTYPSLITFDHTYRSAGEVGLVEKISNLSLKAAKILFIFGALAMVVLYAPSVWFYLNGSSKLTEIIGRKLENKVPSVGAPVVETYQPRLNSSLSKEARVEIPSIGVDSLIHEATYENYEEALKDGIWRVPEFGSPYERTSPTILAAHRFGYLAWSNMFRKENSFYNLPKMEMGDTVEITWRQRSYLYEIYDESKGEEIKDYSADLILYTCEELNSPVRLFKYARLIEI